MRDDAADDVQSAKDKGSTPTRAAHSLLHSSLQAGRKKHPTPPAAQEAASNVPACC